MAKTTLQSHIKNLTVSILPNDNLNLVISSPKDFELTKRLKHLVESYGPSISQKPSPPECPSATTSTVPRQLIIDLQNLFIQNSSSCQTETNTFLVMSKGLLNSNQQEMIPIQRIFWHQLDKVYDEIYQREREVNTESAIVRAVSMPISGDVQAPSSTALLLSALQNQTAIEGLDSEFIKNYGGFISPQYSLPTLVTDVIQKNPQTLGLSGSIAPTNLIGSIGQETTSNVHAVDTSDGLLVSDVHKGLLSLYSSRFMNTPLINMIELGGDLSSVPLTGWFKTKIGDQSVELYQKNLIDLSALDTKVGILSQDWSVTIKETETFRLSKSDLDYKYDGGTYIINPLEVITRDFDMYSDSAKNGLYYGVFSRKPYTFKELFALGGSLRNLWNKIKTIKLPSPQQVLAASQLLGLGLGVAGEITGSAGLVTASNVLKSFNEGLSYLVPSDKVLFSLSGAPNDKVKASIYRHVNAIIPNLILIGFEECNREVMSSQKLRQIIAGQSREIMMVYGTTNRTESLDSYLDISKPPVISIFN